MGALMNQVAEVGCFINSVASLQMSTRRIIIWAVGLSTLALSGATARAAIPSTELYPFPGYDLGAIRAKTKAEWSSDSKELAEAWRLYAELQGAWMPGARKPQKQTIARLDKIKAELESCPKPGWFVAVLNSPGSGQSQLADKIGDQAFERQKSTPEYQALKALAIVYLTEHELDRDGSAQNAGRYFTALSITHPWDWQVHALYSRLLVDARITEPGWEAEKQSLFLNPEPILGDLKFFAFIGSIAAKSKWPEIQEAIRQAAPDRAVAEQAIAESAKLFSSDTKVNIVEPKG
jgi:hypothetical protein